MKEQEGEKKRDQEERVVVVQLISIVLVRVPINMSTYLPYPQRRQEGFFLSDVLKALEFISRQFTTGILVLPPTHINKHRRIRIKGQNDLTLSESNFLLNLSKHMSMK